MGKDGRGDHFGEDALAFASEDSLPSKELSFEETYVGEACSEKGRADGGIGEVKSFDAHLRSRGNLSGRQQAGRHQASRQMGDSSKRRSNARDASPGERADVRTGAHADNPESSSGNTTQELRSDVPEGPGPSKMASRIQRLRSSSLKAFETRKRVPHTLFWSLFRSEIEDLRSRKEKARRERELYLAGVEEDSA